jgi:long-chain fatty acid transport protein
MSTGSKVILGSATAALAVLLLPLTGQAAGFEKPVMFSGKWAPLGGAATAAVRGAESVFFNPAGLGGISGREMTLDASPTSAQFSGPVATTKVETGEQTFSPVAGAFFATGITDQLGFGLGVYSSAGANSSYTDLDYSGAQMGLSSDESSLVDLSNYSDAFDLLKPDIGTELKFIEFSPALGFKLSDSLRVGVAWRALLVSGALHSGKVKEASAPVNAVLVNALLGDLSGTSLTGWRAGLQYTPADDFGLGLSVRGPMSFTLEGTTSGVVEAGSQSWPEVYDLQEGEVTAKTGLPLQASAGAFVKFGGHWTLFPEYTFTQYSSNQKIELSGSVILPDELTGEEVALSDLMLEWKDQHSAKLGVQYDWSDRTAIRAGYIYTTAVPPADRSRATSSAPGVTQTITVGLGFSNLDWGLGLSGVDLGAEYTTLSGEGTNELGVSGKFSNTFMAVHTAFQFRF